jgi:hypothetical protein
MIEWDEVLEDVDWKRGLAVIVLGILIMGGGIFLALDLQHTNTARTLLESDRQEIEDFQKDWVPPKKKVTELKKELKALEAELAAKGVELPETIDRDAVETEIKRIANSDRVEIVKYSPSEKIDGYCLILEVEVSFSSSGPRSAANFMADLGRISYPNTLKSQPVSLLDTTMGVTIEVYSFDLEGWELEKSCVGMTVPDIPERDISGVRVFGSDLQGLKASVEQQRAGLVDVRDESIESCELQTEVEKVKNKIKIIEDKLK